tara:strand:- start:219 stop:1016 length:798 start_codon:yes stop_codon:yes gene_type:complete
MKDLLEKIDGRPVVASVSGGKDSAAMSLFLTELGIEHIRVFMDTGWEHQATYEYLRGPLTDKLGPIQEIKGPLSMVELIRKKGMFPSRRIRFCTQELKVKPIIKFLGSMDDEPINAVGIRSAESKARAALPEWEWQSGFDCEAWRPILRWSFDEVVDIHKRHGLAPNPLYLRGASRVGCFPCIHARKKEIAFVAEDSPERINIIRGLERENGYTFFQGSRERLRIDDVVLWSKTTRGGRQFELFDSTEEDAGCMRWGLCDMGTDE